MNGKNYINRSTGANNKSIVNTEIDLSAYLTSSQISSAYLSNSVAASTYQPLLNSLSVLYGASIACGNFLVNSNNLSTTGTITCGNITTNAATLQGTTNCQSGLTVAGALNQVGVATFTQPIIGPTATTTINGILINSSAISNITNLTYTGTLNSISAATFNFLSGVTSNIQTQINALQPLITSATNLNIGTLTTNGAATINGNLTINAGGISLASNSITGVSSLSANTVSSSGLITAATFQSNGASNFYGGLNLNSNTITGCSGITSSGTITFTGTTNTGIIISSAGVSATTLATTGAATVVGINNSGTLAQSGTSTISNIMTFTTSPVLNVPLQLNYAPTALTNNKIGYFYTGTNLGSNTLSPNITDGTSTVANLVQISNIVVAAAGNYMISVYFNILPVAASTITNFTSILTTSNTVGTISVSAQTISANKLPGSPFNITNWNSTSLSANLLNVEYQCLTQLTAASTIYCLAGQSSFTGTAPTIQTLGIVMTCVRLG